MKRTVKTTIKGFQTIDGAGVKISACIRQPDN